MLNPDERCVMVSGANRGIGLAIARTLHGLGYRVSAGGRDLGALERALGDLERGRLSLHHYDAIDLEAARSWVDETIARWGRIDALINVAGNRLPSNIEDDDEEALDLMWAVNVKGPLRMIRVALPHLRKSGTGRIVNLASLSGKRVRVTNVGYAMTKFAVVALTHTARRLGWEHGIRATALCPGWVDTDMAAQAPATARAEMTRPDDIASLVATLLALPNNAVVAELLVNSRLEDTL